MMLALGVEIFYCGVPVEFRRIKNEFGEFCSPVEDADLG